MADLEPVHFHIGSNWKAPAPQRDYPFARTPLASFCVAAALALACIALAFLIPIGG